MRDYLKHYVGIMTCRFKVSNGGVFAMTPYRKLGNLYSASISDPRPLCFRENDWNRCGFDKILTHDRWNNFEKNLAFAQASRVAWEETLLKMKFQFDRRLFVSNRLYGWQDTVEGFVDFHIIPTLHLYSIGEESAKLDTLYCVKENNADAVWDFRSQKMIPLEQAHELVTADPIQEPLDSPLYRQCLS